MTEKIKAYQSTARYWHNTWLEAVEDIDFYQACGHNLVAKQVQAESLYRAARLVLLELLENERVMNAEA